MIGKVAPKAVQSLLGLRVTFCRTPIRPTLNIDKNMDWFDIDLHIPIVFAGIKDLMPLVNLKTYIRSKWKPRDWGISIALNWLLWTFEMALEPKFQFFPIRHNLLPHQRWTIGFIKSNPNLMVVQTDKCLGLGEINPPEYLRFDIKDHLGYSQVCQCLVPAAAAYCATSVWKQLEKWIKNYLDVLIKEEQKFLRTNLKSNKDPWGFLYLLFRVHKVPLKTHLFVSYCRNLLHPLGNLITECLKPLTRMKKLYFQDSFAFKKELEGKKSHQTPACLFVMQLPCTRISD